MKAESDQVEEESFFVQPIIEAHIISHSPEIIKTRISKAIQFYCLFEAHPIEQFEKFIKWQKYDDDKIFMSQMDFQLSNRTHITRVNETYVNSTYDIGDVFKKDNGTYACIIESPFSTSVTKTELALLVLDYPQISIDHLSAVGANKIFLNWTINDGNDPIKQYYVQYKKDGTSAFTYYNHAIRGGNISYVLDNFEPSTSYEIKLVAENGIGLGPPYTYPQKVKTLEVDPIFVPKIGVKGNTHTTITIGWQAPPPELLEYIHYYELEVAKAGPNSPVVKAYHEQNSRNLPYMFDNLETATDYKFKVKSCSELTKLCGNWSDEVTGTTMDGIASEPLHLNVSCQYFNISGRTTIVAQWDPPDKPNGNITSYQTVLNGVSTFRSEKGLLKNETYGPKVKNVNEKFHKAEYANVPTNTNYTITVSGITRSKRPGESAKATCTMPPTVPDMIGRILWVKVETGAGNWVFKLILPRISERNGPICGYRIYLVRIAKQNNKPSIPPEQLEIMTYHEAHALNNTKGGAYIAEVLSNENFMPEIILGDEQQVRTNDSIIKNVQNELCKKLLKGLYMKSVRRDKATVAPLTEDTTGELNFFFI